MHSRLAQTRSQPPSLVLWRRFKGRQRSGNAKCGKKASGEAIGMGKLEVGQPDWLGVHIWLSLIGSKLGVETKIREVISNQVLAIWANCYQSFC